MDEQPIEFLVIGRIVAPRGIRGEMRVQIESSDPERFNELDHVFLGEEHQRFQVQRSSLFKKQALLRLEGIVDRNTAEEWRGAYVFVQRDDETLLEEGEYYAFEIEGLAVVTDEGEALGEVVEVLVTGANDVYVVHGSGGEILIPAIKDVVLEIDLEAARITVHLPEGLR